MWSELLIISPAILLLASIPCISFYISAVGYSTIFKKQIIEKSKMINKNLVSDRMALITSIKMTTTATVVNVILYSVFHHLNWDIVSFRWNYILLGIFLVDTVQYFYTSTFPYTMVV